VTHRLLFAHVIKRFERPSAVSIVEAVKESSCTSCDSIKTSTVRFMVAMQEIDCAGRSSEAFHATEKRAAEANLLRMGKRPQCHLPPEPQQFYALTNRPEFQNVRMGSQKVFAESIIDRSKGKSGPLIWIKCRRVKSTTQTKL
jgi:hypothetical protein